ncbi:hypothetical protein RJT34_20579 [Clitoria ternatea]|uniref:Uncharacterized protein n=1 Tax=Clitoria ternatea TaxID=43366 RepID=A0AAN9P513_CLITE
MHHLPIIQVGSLKYSPLLCAIPIGQLFTKDLQCNVQKCRRFQTTLFRILLNRDCDKVITSVPEDFSLGDSPEIDYLLLPALKHNSDSIIDWKCVSSFPFFSSENGCDCKNGGSEVWTKNGYVCSCKLENCVVYTSHTRDRLIYMISGITKKDGNSTMQQLNGKVDGSTYKDYFRNRHGIELKYEHQSFLGGRNVFKVRSYLLKDRQRKEKERNRNYVELPPELCDIIMSPISISTIYSFSFIPSIMHWLQSLLLAFNFKKMLSEHCVQNYIPICKVMQALTAKGCQEAYDYDYLETLGDSFLKYAVSQQIFKTNQNHSEGSLRDQRKILVSNDALSKFGCSRRLPGFIRKEVFEPRKWEIPGDKSRNLTLKQELVSSGTRVYVGRTRKIRFKIVADVVEALIGAFITEDEEAALSFINWIGIKRLEFLGDAVLDYVMTMHFYKENSHDKLSSEFLTTMRSISVNDECYALSAIRAKLHEHILCDSAIQKRIAAAMKGAEKLSLESTFGWQMETYFCEVLADVIESIAVAIFVDSGYKKEVVFESIRPLLEPLVTPETAKRHPTDELRELCFKRHYEHKEEAKHGDKYVTLVTIEVKADGNSYKHTAEASTEYIARKVASKEVLKLLKEILAPQGQKQVQHGL